MNHFLTLTDDEHNACYVNGNEIQTFYAYSTPRHKIVTKVFLKGRSGDFWGDGSIRGLESPERITELLMEVEGMPLLEDQDKELAELRANLELCESLLPGLILLMDFAKRVSGISREGKSPLFIECIDWAKEALDLIQREDVPCPIDTFELLVTGMNLKEALDIGEPIRNEQ